MNGGTNNKKKSSVNRKAGTTNAVIDEENVVSNILSRLPVKSLLRFKCVAKHWYSLIKDPCFTDLHLNRSETRQHLFIVKPSQRYSQGNLQTDINYKGRQVSFLIADVFFEREGNGKVVSNIKHITKSTTPFCYTQILGAVKGLVCFINDSVHAACMYNIGTREVTPWIKSTLLIEEAQKSSRNCLGDTSAYSFGYDPGRKEHKLVCKWLIYDGDNAFQIWEILTLGCNAWRRMDQVPCCHFRPDAPSVYVNGSIYWYPLNFVSGDCGDAVVSFLLAFDVGSEKFSTIQIPDFGQLHPNLSFRIQCFCSLDVQSHVAILRRTSSYTARLSIYEDNDKWKGKYKASDIGGKNWTEKIIMLPVDWDESRTIFFHAVAGADQLFLESHQKNASGATNAISLYSYCLKNKIFKQMEIRGIPSSAPA
ncbi:hypothetical protein MKX01_031072 [Papaver californicum]|nr:hypothetical protein MKX01_031072 [Papaver californicum]